LITILGTSFVGAAAVRLASLLVACAGLVLVTPAPASHHRDASNEPDVIEFQVPADSTRDREWRIDVDASVSDACDDEDDDDDDGDDASSAASGPLTSSRADLAPDFSDGSHLSEVTEDRRGSPGRDVHLMRGPPAVPMESSHPVDDDPAGTHCSTSCCGVNPREPHLPFLRDPFRSASAQSDYGLRAPP